ncbi:N-acetylglucosamine-6-phosphate deacetylase [Bacillus sp. V3-13]|uniref:N-acetylglucosamine-6-phosphate deacetylase n=1 Tax=Bacillus sp. V3-13 TaxID=2053728 RepID=UPI000C787590|nr:N-acetylglucosamine-6-phosphate deacetylase [Bacillus sp. V3-13]PLR75227.1 N-acetylglucosamine-6-phosphate deacetylase [Bacillus sp. V3-13]
MQAIQTKKIFTPEKTCEAGYLVVENGRIKEITTIKPECGILDFSRFTAIPGLIDLHIHGIAGYDTMDGSLDALQGISSNLARHGVTGFLPTTLTHDFEKIKQAAKAVHLVMGNTCGAEILGSYIEGPYLTPEHKGAHPTKYMREISLADLDDLIAASNHTIKIITIAPEKHNTIEAIKYLSEKGIIVSLGHTNADYETATHAIENGASISVHTFNGMRGFNHREPGCLGAFLTNEMVFCECIADLRHVYPAAIKLLYKAKGSNHILLISDLMAAADLPDGDYMLGTLAVKVKDRIARTIDTGSLAGSTTNLMDCIKNTQAVLRLPLEQILPMATLNQAKLLGLDKEIGSLEIGKKANVVFIDQDFDVKATMVNGQFVFTKEEIEA